MPSSVEILNLSYNHIKLLPEDVSKKLKNITTIDISNNKL
jgi:Leucine-rich repeat (LRR) protein